jgi:hypothetical protein
MQAREGRGIDLARLVLATALVTSVLGIGPTAAAHSATQDQQSEQDTKPSTTSTSQDQSTTESKTDAGSKTPQADSKNTKPAEQDESRADQQSGGSQKKEPELVTIPEQTIISVRLTEPIDVKESHPGQEYAATINEPVLKNNQVVVPRGTAARIRVLYSRKAGHIRGRAEVVVELVGVILNSKNYPIQASIMEKEGPGVGSKMKKGAADGAHGAAAVAVDAATAPAIAPIEAIPASVSPATALLSAQQLKLEGVRVDFVLSAPIDLPLPKS